MLLNVDLQSDMVTFVGKWILAHVAIITRDECVCSVLCVIVSRLNVINCNGLWLVIHGNSV